MADAEKNIHSVEVVYQKVNGANSEITFDAEITKDGEKVKVPVATKNFEREENHFHF